MQNPLRSLAALRAAIDQVDSKILALLSERGQLAHAVGELKRAGGDTHFYHPDRESEILRRIMQENAGPFTDAQVASIYREIISAGLALEEALQVAYLGPAGTFSQMAAQKHFGHSARFQPSSSIPEIFRLVDSGQTQFGVVPVENSTEGSVNQTLDLLLDYPLQICGEVQLRIVHNLVANIPMAQISRVYVHYQTRAQCRQWLAASLPHVELVDVPSNGVAAERAGNDPEGAAISTTAAAAAYSLQILQAGIEDNPENTTRFLVIGKIATRPTGQDKTSLVVAGINRPGSLHALLSPLADAGVSLTRIESRPARSAVWEYVFYLDLLGHCQDPALSPVLDALAKQASFYRCLGSYPKAVY
ncbi:prephenate dehydratase [Acidithiobacillus montserratensis]|uniref:Prephenate dehydratase n=1 Tax=Acidithiobacillus montserratensis TaxID=2729135 RepID=A0ACD5HI73_9PROT|nr:prephenate dehydratase [Acidithiobacillus montserratensis]MBN2679675.1 prephenate dehydratase [Acidithiobacillaceae bacterium]MBU2748894.1 prephenate dehydratase [Acidithiobacillus montserratensis]